MDREPILGTPEWELSYTLTREEIYRCVKAGDFRRVGKAGTIVETVILGIMAVYCLTAFFLDGMKEGMSLFLGVASLLLIAAVWGVPEFRYRRMASAQAEDRAPTRVRVFQEGLAFGQSDEVFAYGTEWAARLPDMWVLRYGTQLMALPKRAMPEECWEHMNRTIKSYVTKKI
jgi:hypothetical protein